MACNLSIGSTELVTLYSLIDNLTGQFVNNATVSGALLDRDRSTTLTTFSMPYVVASNGEYQGTITSGTTAALTNGTTYQVRVTANAGGNVRVFWDQLTATYSG